MAFNGKPNPALSTCKKRLALVRKPGLIVFHEVNSSANLCINPAPTNFLTLFLVKNPHQADWQYFNNQYLDMGRIIAGFMTSVTSNFVLYILVHL